MTAVATDDAFMTTHMHVIRIHPCRMHSLHEKTQLYLQAKIVNVATKTRQ